MERNKTKILFSLLSSVDKDRCEREAPSLSADELDELLALAKKHDLAHVIAYALYERGIVTNEDSLYERVQKEQIQAIWRYEQTQMVLDEIKETLEGGKVAFVPLKGSVIRELYAEPWLRTSCDIDVLVREDDLEHAAALLEARGYVRKGKNFHELSLFSSTGVHLELHYNITEQTENLDRVLTRVWEYCEVVDGKQYEHRQSPEFLIYHLLAHMSDHFISGGCGIRPFLDIWLLRNKLEYNEQKLAALCDAAELDTFRRNVDALIDVWLGDKQHTPLSAAMESYIFDGGVYGTISNRVILEQAQSGGKAKNILFRLFMPYSLMSERYPVLKKWGILLPLFWVVRWCQVLTKKRFGRSLSEIKSNASNSKEDIRAAERFLSAVGLNPKDR